MKTKRFEITYKIDDDMKKTYWYGSTAEMVRAVFEIFHPETENFKILEIK